MIIRELVSSFGIDFDESGAKRAEDSMKRLDNAFNAIGLGLSFAGVYSGLKAVIGLSSGATEEANVLQQTFGEFSSEVVAWADINAKAMSRSSVDLRKYAGQLGAVLAPMLQNKKAAADMSEQLAGLSVDLASFFNKGDEETMERLRSGILGSTEAVDQLGINLRAEHVQAVMAEQGLKKKFKTLSEGEKVQMRFLTILKDTADKQGDAARTADGYANRTKAAEANVSNLGRAIGDKLMPVAKSTVSVFADMTGGMLDIVNTSAVVETSLTMLAGIGTIVGGSFIAANAGALFFGAGVLALGVVLDDLYVSLEGGEGYFADFFEAALGKDNWKEILATWKFATTELGDLIWEVTHPEEMKRLHGNAQGAYNTRDTTVGRFLNNTLGIPYAEDTEQRAPGVNVQQSSKSGSSSWADEFAAPVRQRSVYDRSRGETRNYGPDPFTYDTDTSHLPNSRAALPFSSDSEAAFSGVSGAMQSLASSVDGLSGVGQSLPVTPDAGAAPMIPLMPTNEATNITLNAGDINMSVGPGTTPDTLREARRTAREMMDDQNRSLIDSASSR